MDRINQKGFTYIIIVVIFIIFITTLFLLFKPLPVINNTSNYIAENYVLELEKLMGNYIDENQLNLLNQGFYDFSKSHNLNVKICTIIDDLNGNIYLSNYLGNTYSNIENKKTIKINKEKNEDEISVGNCYLNSDSESKVSYYISLTDNKEKVVYKNQNLPTSSTNILGEWYDSNWNYRKEIIIDHTKVESNLVNFPVLINISSDDDIKKHSRADGLDIVFTDINGIILNREIEYYDYSTGNLVSWVSIPSLSSTEDTVLYMYYGDIDTSYSNNTDTWDENFVLVQHMDGNADSSEPQFLDSTSYDNDGNASESLASDDKINGKIGYGTYFDKSQNDYITLQDSNELISTAPVTLSAWVKTKTDHTPYGSSESGRLITLHRISTASTGLSLAIGQKISVGPEDGPWLLYYSGSTHIPIAVTKEYYDYQYHYIVGTHSGSEVKLYYDGNLEITSEGTLGTIGSHNACIGKFDGATANHDVNGIIDEVRISKTVRSEEWIKTEWNNQSATSNFYSIGEEEHS